MSIILKVYNTYTLIEGSLDSKKYKLLKKALGYKDPQAMWKNSNGKWDGIVSTVCYNRKYCKCYIKKDGTHFPTGLLRLAREFFDFHNIQYTAIDNRSKVEKTLNLEENPEFPSFDYQKETIEKACKQTRGIIKAATGSGKTKIGAGIIAKLGVAPFVFYVPSKDLLNQAKEEIEKFTLLNGSPLQVGVIGDGKCDIRDVNVMTMQTAVRSIGCNYESFDDEETSDNDDSLIEKREEIYNLIYNAKGIIGDECHCWAASTCQAISDHSVNAKYKYGLSATPFRDLGDDLLIEACFGKTISDIRASFLIEKGFLVQPYIHFIHTKKYKTEESYQTIYKKYIVENEERNNLVRDAALKMANSGRKVLILIKHIPHGENLESIIPGSFFIHGSHSSKDRNEHIEKMRKGDALITISTSIFDQGVDVKPLDGLILAGSGKSSTRGLQRIGRIIRTYTNPITKYVKKNAIAFDFQDHVRILSSHSYARKKIYMTEPKFIIKECYPYA